MTAKESDVPLLVGATNGDYLNLRTGVRDVLPFRGQHSKSSIFVYKFNRMPAGWSERGILCGHGGELPYLFNFPPMFLNNYLFDLVQDPATGRRPEVADLNGDGVTGTAGDPADVLASAGFNEEDVKYADTVMTVWTTFAKSGNPSTPALSWTPYTPANDTYVEFGASTIEVKTGLAAAFQ